jgi:hypothetical protein
MWCGGCCSLAASAAQPEGTDRQTARRTLHTEGGVGLQRLSRTSIRLSCVGWRVARGPSPPAAGGRSTRIDASAGAPSR